MSSIYTQKQNQKFKLSDFVNLNQKIDLHLAIQDITMSTFKLNNNTFLKTDRPISANRLEVDQVILTDRISENTNKQKFVISKKNKRNHTLQNSSEVIKKIQEQKQEQIIKKNVDFDNQNDKNYSKQQQQFQKDARYFKNQNSLLNFKLENLQKPFQQQRISKDIRIKTLPDQNQTKQTQIQVNNCSNDQGSQKKQNQNQSQMKFENILDEEIYQDTNSRNQFYNQILQNISKSNSDSTAHTQEQFQILKPRALQNAHKQIKIKKHQYNQPISCNSSDYSIDIYDNQYIDIKVDQTKKSLLQLYKFRYENFPNQKEKISKASVIYNVNQLINEFADLNYDFSEQKQEIQNQEIQNQIQIKSQIQLALQFYKNKCKFDKNNEPKNNVVIDKNTQKQNKSNSLIENNYHYVNIRQKQNESLLNQETNIGINPLNDEYQQIQKIEKNSLINNDCRNKEKDNKNQIMRQLDQFKNQSFKNNEQSQILPQKEIQITNQQINENQRQNKIKLDQQQSIYKLAYLIENLKQQQKQQQIIKQKLKLQNEKPQQKKSNQFMKWIRGKFVNLQCGKINEDDVLTPKRRCNTQRDYNQEQQNEQPEDIYSSLSSRDQNYKRVQTDGDHDNPKFQQFQFKNMIFKKHF